MVNDNNTRLKQIVLQNDTLVAAITNVHYFYTLPQLLLLLLLWFSSFCRQQCRKTETAIIHTIRHTQTHGSVPPPPPIIMLNCSVKKSNFLCLNLLSHHFSTYPFSFSFSFFLGQILWQRREKRGRWWRRWWWKE